MGTPRNLTLDIQRALSNTRSSVTPLLNPSSVAARAAAIRQSIMGGPTQVPYEPPTLPTSMYGGTQPEAAPATKSIGPTPTIRPTAPPTVAVTPAPQQHPVASQPTIPSQTHPNPTEVSSWESYIQNLLDQESALNDARRRAAGLDAWLATASYDSQLQILSQEIARAREAASRVQGQWDVWREGALKAIKENAQQTQAAYAEYIDLINQGFSEYDALARSRYAEYQAAARSAVEQYLQTTNTQYADFVASLPPTWGPVTDAIVTGNQAAMAEIRAEQAAAKDSIEGQVLAASGRFAEELENIGADNPALVTELLADLHTTAATALAGADLQGDAGVALQDATAQIATRLVDHTLATSLKGAEQERLTAVNAAARQRHQLLTASNHELESILERSGRTREQMLVDVDADLRARLASLNEAEDEIRRSAEDGAREMSYSLSQSIQDLVNRQFTTSQSRQLAQASAVLSSDLYENMQLSATEVAGGFAAQALSRLNLNEVLRGQILEDVTGLFADGIDDAADFWRWIRENEEAGNADQVPDPTLRQYYATAITAMAQGFENYERDYGSVREGAAYVSPIGGEYRINSLYGLRPDAEHPGEQEFHHGIDLSASRGTPVNAVRGGRLVRYTNADAGNAVYIDHGDGTISKYAHLDGWANVPPTGTMVRPGDRIGSVGKTGNARSYHLHFSFWVEGQAVDPMAIGVFRP